MLTTKADAARIANFIEKVRDMPAPSARGAALAELKWIHSREKPNGERYTPLTNRKLIISYRDQIREVLGPDAPVLKYLAYSDARTKEYREHQLVGRQEKHRHLRPVVAREFVTAAEGLLSGVVDNGWHYPSAIAGVCALTGRRPFEVGCTGQFLPDPRPGWIQFSGQLKTRDADRAAEVFPIPVLGSRDLVLEALAMIRAHIPANLKGTEFSQSYAKLTGQTSKRVFRDAHGDPIIPRDLREAYSAIAVRRFAPSSVSDVQFINDILGHKADTLDTTLYYIGFTVV